MLQKLDQAEALENALRMALLSEESELVISASQLVKDHGGELHCFEQRPDGVYVIGVSFVDHFSAEKWYEININKKAVPD